MKSKRRPALATALRVIFGVCILNSAVLTAIIACPSRAIAPRASSNTAPSSDQYLVEFNGPSLPKDFSRRIANLGGQIVGVFPEINVALVRNLTESAAAALAAQPAVADVTKDELISAADAFRNEQFRTTQSFAGASSFTNPVDATWFAYQWNLRG